MARRFTVIYPARSPSEPKPAPQRSWSKSSEIGVNLHHLRSNVMRLAQRRTNPPDFLAVLTIADLITASLRDMASLLRTHDALVAAGEPMARELESAIESISNEMNARRCSLLIRPRRPKRRRISSRV